MTECQDGKELFSLVTSGSQLSLSSCAWSPSSSTLQMATVDEKQATLWRLGQSTATVTIQCMLGGQYIETVTISTKGSDTYKPG